MEHPDWSDGQVADALNEDNRRHRRPGIVSASMVQSAVYRNRRKWAALGFTLPSVPRRSQYIRDLMQLRGFRKLSTEENTHSLPLKRLRQCERLHQGLPVPDAEASKARSWEAEMLASRTVVDIDPDGRAYVREARAWELDANGNLLGLTAKASPGSDGSIDLLIPNLDDEAEAAIMADEDLDQTGKHRVIAELRMTRTLHLIDGSSPEEEAEENSAEAVSNGTKA